MNDAANKSAPSGPQKKGKAGRKGQAPDISSERNFRFYDNRQKYLLFVNTCSEKKVVADRVGHELDHIRPSPPAVRVFDAGMGDGTVLTRVMRKMHNRYPTMPFYVVGKEISLEDVRLSLEKMPDRFFEHPATVLVVTNLYYSEAPGLTPGTSYSGAPLKWEEVRLSGTTAAEFERQITDLEPFLAEHWRVRASKTTGNPLYVEPTVLVIYREDHRFLLDSVIPTPNGVSAEYDLVIASQPYRARQSLDFKVQKVLTPLTTALAPGGRMVVIHSHGNDPGLEVIRAVWPGEEPFRHDRHMLLDRLKEEAPASLRDLRFDSIADAQALFRYDMHTLPDEISESIGTSTLFAAWNAAIYVAQIEDARLDEAIRDHGYLDATRDVLRRHGGLWFWDESFVIRRRGP